jgi:dTDP-4-dehydrorhamnose 3,5-epimerase-like enzyme
MIINIIKGTTHKDHRGTLTYVNDFNMREVKRMYMIHHTDKVTKRGWRGHKLEQRWFFVTQGQFKVSFVKIDNWENPNPNLNITTYELSASEASVLHMPSGYASCLQALVPNSTILVYANASIEEASLDNYQYDPSYFNNWKK